MRYLFFVLFAVLTSLAGAEETLRQSLCSTTLLVDKFIFILEKSHQIRVRPLGYLVEAEMPPCDDDYGGGICSWSEIVDLNGDGYFDLIVSVFSGGMWRGDMGYYVFLNCGNDTFVRIMDESFTFVGSSKTVSKNGFLELVALRTKKIDKTRNNFEDSNLYFQKYTLSFDTKKSKYLVTGAGSKLSFKEAEGGWATKDWATKDVPENFNNWNAFPVIDKAFIPSFDCTKARIQVEKMICNDENIGWLDTYLAFNFRSLKAAIVASDQEKLIADQRAWLKQRDSCKTTECLKDIYRTRIGEICNNYSVNPAKELQCYLESPWQE